MLILKAIAKLCKILMVGFLLVLTITFSLPGQAQNQTTDTQNIGGLSGCNFNDATIGIQNAIGFDTNGNGKLDENEKYSPEESRQIIENNRVARRENLISCLQQIQNILFIVASFVILIRVTIAGFALLTASGNTDANKAIYKTITDVFVGIVIMGIPVLLIGSINETSLRVAFNFFEDVGIATAEDNPFNVTGVNSIDPSTNENNTNGGTNGGNTGSQGGNTENNNPENPSDNNPDNPVNNEPGGGSNQ